MNVYMVKRDNGKIVAKVSMRADAPTVDYTIKAFEDIGYERVDLASYKLANVAHA